MNMPSQLQQKLILGVGGNKSGVTVYDVSLDRLGRILSLPSGQSVYAVDVDGKTIAAGTKRGAIYRLAQQPDTVRRDYEIEQLTSCIAAPVLSVCLVNQRTLAVSDTVARCLLWQPGKREPDTLPTGKRTISSLFRLDERHIAGLSSDGEVIVWDWIEGEIVQIVEVPAPPDNLSALVRPVYWYAAGRWVWPGRGGVIVFYNRPRNEVRSISAHSSEAYAVVVCNDELLTIGIDGSVRCWRVGTDEPVSSCEAPEGIISAAFWSSQQSRMLLLINSEGKAGVYSWTDSRLKFQKHLEGDNYRIALGPDMQKVASALRHQKATCAREICVQIKERMARRELGGSLDDLHQQLVQAGYEHVSLVLRAEEYRNNKDIASDLQCYKKLLGLVPEEDERAKNSLLRYAGLLETVWQHELACVIYKQLARIHPEHNGYAESMCRVSKYVSIIEDGEYVIEPDVPLPSLAKSATVLNKMFTGRYVVKNIGESINCNVIVSAGGFIKKYAQLCKNSEMPRAKQTELWWLSKDRTEQVTTVILKSEDSELFSRLELGIKFLDACLQTVLVPVVVFNAGEKTNEVSIEQHNQNILNVLQRILTDGPLLRGWLKIIYGDVRDAIRQLVTKAIADKNR